MGNRESWLKIAGIAIFALITCGILTPGHNAAAWSNAGYSDNPSNPVYGTHDWIAEHAMNWLPSNESQWLLQNKNAFLYGTEAPDNKDASFEGHSGYGDQRTKHHNYYSGTTCTDDASAKRANEEYQKALSVIQSNGSLALAAWYAGAMTHYIDDVACWAHVLSDESSDAHSEFETQVNIVTKSYGASTFSISFDGTLGNVSAYDASRLLGLDTYGDNGETYTALWMNSHFSIVWSGVSDWSSEIGERTRESLNLAANMVADVLHTLTVDSSIGGVATQGAEIPPDLLLEIAAVAVIVAVAIYTISRRRR